MRQKIGWSMIGLLVFALICGLWVPLGMATTWWVSAAAVGSIVLLFVFISVALWLTEQKGAE